MRCLGRSFVRWAFGRALSSHSGWAFKRRKKKIEVAVNHRKERVRHSCISSRESSTTILHHDEDQSVLSKLEERIWCLDEQPSERPSHLGLLSPETRLSRPLLPPPTLPRMTAETLKNPCPTPYSPKALYHTTTRCTASVPWLLCEPSSAFPQRPQEQAVRITAVNVSPGLMQML